MGGDETDAHRTPDPGADLAKPRHICAFFTDVDEQYRVLRAFVKAGLDRGDRAFHLVDPERRGEHLRRLAEAEIDVRTAIDTGQLQVQVWEPNGADGRRFDPDAWLRSFRRALESGPEAGYARTRFLGHMEWAHADAADDGDWFEFEARLNEVLAEHEDIVICAYDLRVIGAGMVIDALRTHSAVLLDGLLQENPFFAPPDEFVREIRERRRRRARPGR